MLASNVRHTDGAPVRAAEWQDLDGALVDVRRTARGRQGRHALDVRLADAAIAEARSAA